MDGPFESPGRFLLGRSPPLSAPFRGHRLYPRKVDWVHHRFRHDEVVVDVLLFLVDVGYDRVPEVQLNRKFQLQS